MRTARWKDLARAMAAASLCIAAIGCGDDSGSDMGMDLGPRDMSVNMDLTTGGDMVMPPGLPSGAIIAGDVQGVVYITDVDGGEKMIGTAATAPLTHRLVAVTNFPMASSVPSDFSNLTTNVGTLTISGCVANRYDSTSATGHMTTPDVDVGTVTLGAVTMGTVNASGWDTKRYALSSPTTFFNPPVPASATCMRNGTTMSYGCAFAGTLGGATAAGVPLSLGVFPALSPAMWTGLGGSLTDCDTTGHPGLCEQRLLYPPVAGVDGGASGGSTFGFNIPGGAPYAAATKSVTIPAAAAIESISVGTTAICTTTPSKTCTLNDLSSVAFDKTKDLSIVFSCDTTVNGGMACGGSPFDIYTLIGKTSQKTRGQFGDSPTYGTLNCLEQTKKADHTVTVPAAAWAAMVGNQTGGSMTLNLVRAAGTLGQLNPNQLYEAGSGSFVFINLP